MPLLPLGSSFPLQTILLSDLIGCDSLLQIVMAVWRTFLKFEALQIDITICSGQSHPTGWAALPSENISLRFFSRAEKPSEGIARCLFLMNMKGLTRNVQKKVFYPNGLQAMCVCESVSGGGIWGVEKKRASSVCVGKSLPSRKRFVYPRKRGQKHHLTS